MVMKKRQGEKMDLLSDLPQPIVHHIMSFLPALDLTKISILSKRFFFLWRTSPVIDFDESAFSRGGGTFDSQKQDFIHHIYKSIRLRRRGTHTTISEFSVKADLKGISADRKLDSAISLALDNGVKSMNLNFGYANYRLHALFASRSINVLRLKGLKLDLCKITFACPSLKILFLTSCVILGDINFSSQSLRKIELHHCCDVRFIKISAPKLHSFSFDAGTKDPQPCRIDVLQCQNIAYLSLNNVVTAHDWVEKHASTLGKLQTFIFIGCLDINSISIRNERVERIEIANCRLLSSIEVKAPSLESFQYNGTNDNTVSNITFIASKYINDLYIENAGITDEWLETQLPTLCSLKSLRLGGCQVFNRISIRNERVERVEINYCPSLTSIEVIAPSLESFQYINGTKTDDKLSNISFIDSKSIKDLYIENAGITDECLKTQLTALCYLKSLKLKACNSLKNIEVIHEKLQILELSNCLNLKEAEIDTPQLVSFMHLGNMIEIDKLITRSICTANLFTNPWIAYNQSSFYGWKKLLSCFGHFRALKLICNCKKELIIPKDLREIFVPPMYDLQSLEVHVKSLERIETDLVDSLLWLSPLPNTIRISVGSPSQLQMIINFAYNKTMNEEEEEEEDKKPFCCKSKPVKCWRHTLRWLDIQTRDKNGSVELRKYFLTNAKMLEAFSLNKLQDDFNLID